MHSSCNDGVIQISPLSSYAVLEVIEISHLLCSTHHIQPDLNPANMEATIDAERILNSLSSSENGIF